MADLCWHRIDSDGTVHFRSAGHISGMVLRALYEKDTGFDIELLGTATTGDDLDSLQPIRAHRLILMSVSKHLYELFTADGCINSQQTRFKLTEIGHESLSDIIKFIYIDELNFEADCASERMQNVLIGAKFLVMPDLANACEAYLLSDRHLNLQNCVFLLRFARMHSCPSLLFAGLSFAARNLPHFIDDSSFLNLSKEEMSKFLMSEPVIALANADQRCRAAVAWLNHDRASRDACASDILGMVPFDLKTISFSTMAAVGNNSAIRAEYAQKFMDTICDYVVKYHRNDIHRNYANRAVLDVWWNEDNSISRSDVWYVMGGLDAETEFVKYDVQRRYWVELPDLPWTRSYGGACLVRNKTIFLFGGEKDDEISADIDQYDLSTREWTTNPTKLSAARFKGSACVVGRVGVCKNDEQSVLICGGYPGSAHVLVEKFRVCKNLDGEASYVLERMPDMSVGRYHIAPVYANDAVFVAGGVTDTGRCRLTSIEKYDCVANKWSTVGNMKCGARSSLMAAVFGDDLYLAGGRHDGGGAVDAVEIFNIRTSQLRQAPNMLTARCIGSGVALDHNTFCVVGGGVGVASLSSVRSVECFDIREGKWSTGVIVPDMPTANRKFCFAHA